MRAERSRPGAAGLPVEPEITLSEEGGVRYLHFGSPWVQGAMRIRRPDQLEIPYVRDMMAWLLFLEPRGRILQLGLGAGSLLRFCHRHCAPAAITVVEISRAVVAANRRWFQLPDEDARFELVTADAGVWVASPHGRGRFDVVQVDLYDREAAGPVLDSEDFYADCRAMLTEPGAMAVNLFGRHASFDRSLRRIRKVFGAQVFTLPPREEGNLVVLALKGPPLAITRRMLFERALQIEARYRLPARGWAKTIRIDSPPPAQ
ncbi:MAG: spermidine synthase [Lautropia sp.]